MASNETEKDYLLTNSQYDLLKKIVTLGLPALAALYAGLSKIWGWPYGEEVVSSIALLTVFLGVVLGFSSRSYNNSETKYDGEVVVTETNTGRPAYDFQTSGDIDELAHKSEVLFKVQTPH